jgi:hypothetical protein
MHLVYTEELVQARLAERLAEIDLATAPRRMRPVGHRRRFGRRRRPTGVESIA